jgi:hypothetical protein
MVSKKAAEQSTRAFCNYSITQLVNLNSDQILRGKQRTVIVHCTFRDHYCY